MNAELDKRQRKNILVAENLMGPMAYFFFFFCILEWQFCIGLLITCK